MKEQVTDAINEALHYVYTADLGKVQRPAVRCGLARLLWIMEQQGLITDTDYSNILYGWEEYYDD